MKYLVVVDAGTNIFTDEFTTLSEANGEALYIYNRYQKLPNHCPERKRHIYVATPVDDGDGDMDVEDNYFDSKTFYLPEEEDCFDNLWAEVYETRSDNGNVDFVVGIGREEFVFSVPWNLIEDHYDEDLGEFDEVGGEIIYEFYRDAVQERIEDILAFYELD